WAPGDQIAVVGYDDGNKVKGSTVLTTFDYGSSSATFSGTAIGGATKYKVYYPKEAVDHTTGAKRYQACLDELTASSAADVKVILSSGTDYVVNPETDKVILVWESALLGITLSDLPALTGIDKVDFTYETALGWSVDHPLKFTTSQTVSATPKVYIPFIPDGGGVKAGGKILVSVYDGSSCWDYTATSSSGKIHHKGYRYELDANYWMPYAGFTIGSTVWAEANVDDDGGKFATNSYDYGRFYQWGRNKAWASSGDVSNWDGSMPTGDNWNGGKGPCPPGWRLPTKDELDALTSLPAKKSSLINEWELTNAGGHQLFLPAPGFRNLGGALKAPGTSSYYWSATPFNSSDVHLLVLGYSIYLGHIDRHHGLSVRCVQD
ncbi:MAG: fibrobacter succinogenes major paralogous domain-containing protein, partial [Dysgonamonadaceae bacterium]|nr:fibrobacter succinogenes major paralogous domain-containing protein [Dysgonamonadaceae bacterium]